jgi:hypothetical protein
MHEAGPAEPDNQTDSQKGGPALLFFLERRSDQRGKGDEEWDICSLHSMRAMGWRRM